MAHGDWVSTMIGDLEFESGDARFPDFSTGELKIHVDGHGDAASALSFLRATPLDATDPARPMLWLAAVTW